MLILAFRAVIVAKNPLASAGDTRDRGLIAWSGRSLGGEHSSPLQYSGLENPMDRGAWWATVQRVAESRKRLMRLSIHAAEHGFELRFHHLLTAYFISGKLLDLLQPQLPHWCPGNKVLPQNLPILLNGITNIYKEPDTISCSKRASSLLHLFSTHSPNERMDEYLGGKQSLSGSSQIRQEEEVRAEGWATGMQQASPALPDAHLLPPSIETQVADA